MERRRQIKRRKPKKKPVLRKRIIEIIIAILLIIGVAWTLAAIYHQYDRSRNAQWQNQVEAVQNGSSKEFKQISPDVPLYVLLVGVDDNSPTQSNFVGLAAINKDKSHIDFIMLPDNTKIEGRKEKQPQHLSDIYSEGGLKLTRAVVEDIFHIPVPFYIVMTKDSFMKLVNTMDGISIYVERDMYHEDDAGVTDIDLQQGYQHLDGEGALGYMMFLDGDGLLSRAQRQERFVKLFYEAAEKHFAFTNMYRIYRFWGAVDSNIPAMDMAKLAYSFKDVPASDIKFYMLPGELNRNKKDSFWTFDPVGVQKIIGTTNNAIASDSNGNDNKS